MAVMTHSLPADPPFGVLPAKLVMLSQPEERMSEFAERYDAWVRAYLKAWESNNPSDIGALFTENASYFTTPYREAWVGRGKIVHGWLDRKDQPGTWSFEYEVLIADAGLGVIKGVTRYQDPDPDYVNLWLIRLDAAGKQCAEFTEYWMEID